MRSREKNKIVRILSWCWSFVRGGVQLGDGLLSKFKLIYMFFRWKLVQGEAQYRLRILPLPKSINLVFNGRKFTVAVPDDPIAAQIIYEIFICEDYKINFSNPPHIIFDVGAYFGMASLYFSCLYPQAKIYAFEVSSKNYQFLKKNTAAFKNVETFHVGLFSNSGPAKLYLHNSGGANSLLTREGPVEEIQTITLDEFMNSNAITHIDLMKMDVEGSEEAILTTTQNINRVDFILGELHLNLIDEKKVMGVLQQHFDVESSLIEPRLAIFKASPKRVLQ